MRYRLNQWVPSLRGRFAHTKFRVAVHAMTVRALTPREIGVLAGLNKHEVQDLLSELGLMGALDHENGAHPVGLAHGRASGVGTINVERPRSKTLVAVRRWLSGHCRALARRRRSAASVWLSTVEGG
jgi:hypothetical protein